jgi:hypothetical protein
MTATAHALVGGAIAASIPDPALGIILATTSHPLLDLIPHWDFGWGWRKKTKIKLFLQAVFDLLLGFVVAYFLFGRHVEFWYFLSCVIASEAWDMAEAPYWFLGWTFPPFNWIYNIQHHMQGKTKTVIGGIFNQAAVVSVLILALFMIPKL